MTTGLALFFVIPNLFRDLVFGSKALGFKIPGLWAGFFIPDREVGFRVSVSNRR